MPEPVSVVKAILDLIEKVSPRAAVTVFIVALVLVAVPWLRPGLVPWIDTFTGEYAMPLGITLLLSGVASLTYAATGSVSAISRRRAAVRAAKAKAIAESDRIAAFHARLGALTLTEKHILQEYIEGNTRAVQFNATLGRHDALCASGILRVTQLYGVKATYLISDEAWTYLSVHRDLIATPDHPRPTRDFYSEY